MPDIVVSSIGHSGSITYNGQNNFNVTDAGSVYAPSSGSTTTIGTYGTGDVISERFVAPTGMKFVFTPPDFGSQPQFGGYLSSLARWSGTGTGFARQLQTASTGTFGGLQGTAPAVSQYSLADVNATGAAYAIAGPGAYFDITSGDPFSFTSLTATFVVPSTSGGGSGLLMLSQPTFQVGLGWIRNGLPDVFPQPGPVFTLQSVPEPTFSLAAIFLCGHASRGRRSTKVL